MMASTTSIAPTASSNTANIQNSASAQKDGSNRTTMKASNNTKATERGRKESPVDAGRRAGAPKAWTSGTNPITQRTTTPVQQNGNTSQTKPSNGSKMVPQKESSLSDKHSHDRLRFLLGGTIGLSMLFTTKNGDKYEGIFAGSTEAATSTKISLKMTKKVQSSAMTQSNGVISKEAAFVGSSPDHTMSFDFRDMADITIPEFSFPEVSKQVNGTTSDFKTDVDISGNITNRGERALRKWVPDGPETTDFSLGSGSASGWDQFAAHDKMFGGQSTYTEETYTTSIDRSAPGFKRKEAEAARLAREIESQSTSNAHLKEERGQTIENDADNEEDKYSGVQRDDHSIPALPVGGVNKYMPPARRAPTAHPTVPGAPVDPAIVSAQLSRPDVPKSTSEAVVSKPIIEINEAEISTAEPLATSVSKPIDDTASKPESISTSTSPQRNIIAENPSQDVEHKVLGRFREFAIAERARIAEKKRVQANQDRTAKLNEFKRFSSTFKLNSPIPTDLVGILAKDPAKQEAILEKAQKDHEEAKSVGVSAATSPTGVAPTPAESIVTPKFDKSQIPPPIPDRATFNRGRGGFPQHTVPRNERGGSTQTQFAQRGAPFSQRPTGPVQDRKAGQAQPLPAPIPLPEPRIPTGPMADQSGMTSPQRSNMHTPTLAASLKFNVKAMEFRPNATAPTFNPTAPSNAPSSPASTQRPGSVAQDATPSSFFGSKKPIPASERLDVTKNFNAIKKLKQDIAARKSEKSDEPVRDYAFNGGIPNAYRTQPTWTVLEENMNKTYTDVFGGAAPPTPSSTQSRNGSTMAASYQSQIPNMTNGIPSAPQMGTPHHAPHAGLQNYPHQFDEHRMHIQNGTPQVYPSPSMASRQMSTYASPMGHPAQLAYGQTPYFGGPNGQVGMHIRQYPNNMGMMHLQGGQMSAPMMVQQQSNGPYMAVPQHYNQMSMYSPNPGQGYPQNGYPSPGRVAPMMMQQNSQHSHHGGQPMIYPNPGQGGPMMYGQQQNMMRGSFGGHQGPYGSSPHQSHQMSQRAMSSGYNAKVMSQMTSNTGPPPNAPQQPAAFGQVEAASSEETK